MPELPDLESYLAALSPRLLGQRLLRVRLASPFLLRSVTPPLAAACGREVVALGRLGKRLVLSLAGDLHLVLHLMIAGRLRWRAPGEASRGRAVLAALDFTSGSLVVTEAGSKRRASLFLVEGPEELAQHDPGGLEVDAASDGELTARLTAENHTLKRALTDPRLLAGIGNTYSDEILHRARLSPFRRTRDLAGPDMARLLAACREVLGEWRRRLIAEAGDAFPKKVTAFRPGMAVHGRFGEPCPTCGAPVQRIVYAENEANYCAPCQTGGRLLADRALSRLLKEDWPASLEELEERLPGRAAGGAFAPPSPGRRRRAR